MMVERVSTFLMFDGEAEEALSLYKRVFESAVVGTIEKYGPDEKEMNGKIKRAELSFGGQNFKLFDSPVKHDFGFTPAISIFIDCESEEEVEKKVAALSVDGQVFMPLDTYDFSQKFAWIADEFGVSWQLNLP